MTTPQQSQRKHFLMLHFIVGIWGFAGIFGKAITLDAPQLIWYRMLIATASIFVYMLIKGIPLRITKKELLNYFSVGGIIACHWICFYAAIKTSNISITLACFSTNALFTALLEPLFFKRRLSWVEIVCSIIAIAAIALIVNIDPKFNTGVILSILSAFGAALFTIFNSMLVRKGDARAITLYELFFGFIILTLFLAATSKINASLFEVSMNDAVLLFIFGSFATAYTFLTSMDILKHISPYTVNLTVNLEVVYGIILAYFIFGGDEKMNLQFYIGTGMILLSLLLNAFLKKRGSKQLP